MAAWWSWLRSGGNVVGGGFLRKKKLIESLETKNDAFLGVLWTFRDKVEIKDVDNHTF